MVKTRTLFAAKDLEITHQQQAVFAALVTTGGGTFDKGTVVADTRIDDSGLTGGSTNQGDLIPMLTPLVYDTAATAGWRVWTNGQDIDGFAGGQTGLSLHETGYVKTTDAGEVMGVVILGGKIPADQVVLPAGESQSNLDAALQTGLRAKGFNILNLDGVN
jgi:hypothetical protein